MKSKEDILTPFIEHSSNMFDEPKDIVEDCNCYLAMEEYAKQESIEFAEFIQEHSYAKGKNGWYQYYLQVTDYPAGFSMSTPVYEWITIEQLYETYLQHKNKQL